MMEAAFTVLAHVQSLAHAFAQGLVDARAGALQRRLVARLFLVVSSDLGSDGVGVVLHGFVVVEFFCCKVRRFFATGAQKKRRGKADCTRSCRWLIYRS
jgi:hypothetical protein